MERDIAISMATPLSYCRIVTLPVNAFCSVLPSRSPRLAALPFTRAPFPSMKARETSTGRRRSGFACNLLLSCLFSFFFLTIPVYCITHIFLHSLGLATPLRSSPASYPAPYPCCFTDTALFPFALLISSHCLHCL